VSLAPADVDRAALRTAVCRVLIEAVLAEHTPVSVASPVPEGGSRAAEAEGIGT
jgi:hypothetical protein